MKSSILKSITLLFIFAITFCSCDKDDVAKKNAFDINKPEGYCIYLKYTNEKGTDPGNMLLDFLPGKIVNIYHVQAKGLRLEYKLIDNNIIEINGNPEKIRIVFEDDKIISVGSIEKDFNYTEYKLIKKPESNILSGRSFEGQYYHPNGKLLHQYFIYSFNADTDKLDASAREGKAERTETYISVCNIAAYCQVTNSKDSEFLISVDGKLEVNYYNASVRELQYGTLLKK